MAALTQAGERGPQALVGCIDDEVADDLAEYTTGHRRHRARGEERCCRAEAHRRSQGRGQEVLAASRQALHGCAGYVQVRGAHDVIDESGREGESLRIGKDTRQEFGQLGGRLMGRLVGPAAGPNNRPLPQGP